MAKKVKKANKKYTYVLPKGVTTMTFQISKSVKARIKAKRAKTGETMREFINSAIDKALKRAA